MIQQSLLERFEQYLLEEKFHVGDKLPVEQELAKHFGVGRNTIREIIIHLSLLGVLKRRPNRGTILAMPSLECIGRGLAFQLYWLGCGREELKATRMMLEMAIAEEVIRCITPAQLDKIIGINDQMNEVVNDPATADTFDLAFHLALQEIAGNRVMQVFSHVLGLMFRKDFRQNQLTSDTARNSVASHHEMISCIRNKNIVGFKQLIFQHINPL